MTQRSFRKLFPGIFNGIFFSNFSICFLNKAENLKKHFLRGKTINALNLKSLLEEEIERFIYNRLYRKMKLHFTVEDRFKIHRRYPFSQHLNSPKKCCEKGSLLRKGGVAKRATSGVIK